MKSKYFVMACICLFTHFLSLRAGRLVQSFNDGWQFATCDVASWQELQTSNPVWQQIHLPHTWNLDAYTERNYRRFTSWYKKEFRLPYSQINGRRFYLKFDAVNSLADVYLNGERLLTHKGGYTAFVIDITDKLKADSLNVLLVRADNRNRQIPPLSGDFTILEAFTAMCG